MKITLNGYIRKFLFNVPIEADIRVSIPLEFFLKEKVKKHILKALEKNGFTGIVEINQEFFELKNGKKIVK